MAYGTEFYGGARYGGESESAFDQTIALPLIQGGTVFAPEFDLVISVPLIQGGTMFGPDVELGEIIDVPLIQGGTVFAPEVQVDQTIELALIQGGSVFAPDVLSGDSILVPLIQGGTVFAPTVSVPLQIELPLIEGGTVFSPSVGREQFLSVPFIPGGWVFGPNVVRTEDLSSGLVAYVGATALDSSFGRTWTDELAGKGSWTLSLQNDDPALVDFDDVVRFHIAGEARFAGVVESRRVVSVSPGEEHDQVTTLSGRSTLALLDQTLVFPSRGVGAIPLEVTRSFAWMSKDFDVSAWPNAKRIRRADQRATRTPHPYSPDWWPDKQAWWIWGDVDEASDFDAPIGTCLFRHTFTVDEPGTIAIFAGFDNHGTLWFDGAEIINYEYAVASYMVGKRIELDVSAGEHTIAMQCRNEGRGGGVILTVRQIDPDGLLGAILTRSDSDWKSLPYITEAPGFSPGRAARLLLEEAQGDGELLDWVLDFTDFQDSEGNPWTSPSEITVDVGRTYLDMILSLTDWLVDVQAAPGANVLRMWNWGTRGEEKPVELALTADPATSEITSMTHEGIRTRANRMLIRHRGAWSVVEDDDSIDDHGSRTAFVDLGAVDSSATARRIARKLMELRKDPSYATTVTLAPVASQPYVSFDNGDVIGHPGHDLETTESKVRSLSMSEDDDGQIEWSLELNDVRREVEDKQQIWLERFAEGGLAGGARVVTRSGDSLDPPQAIGVTSVGEISFDGALAAGLSPARPSEAAGNLIEYYATLTTPGSTSTFIAVLKNGVQIGDLMEIPAGAFHAEIDLNAEKTFRNIDRYQVEILVAGDGAQGLDVQIRAI